MFRSRDKIKFLSLERVWFANTEVKSDADMIRYMRRKYPLQGFSVVNEIAETVFSDIQVETETLLSKCTKTVKYEVNKCAKESVAIHFYNAKDLLHSPEITNEFELAYIDFAKDLEDKSVLAAYSRHKIENMIDSDCILISKAEKESIAIYHVYAWGNDAACLLYSVSNFRNDSSLRNLAGRMNKLLHIRDIEWFRQNGVRIYDWGNISSSTNPNGIDKFKLSFGGEIVTVYNILIGNSILGKIFSLIYKLKHH